MPMDRSRYPADWERRALAVKEAAGWACEKCGRPCRRTAGKNKEPIGPFVIRLLKSLCFAPWDRPVAMAQEALLNPQRYTLTTAHPHHDPENPEAELRAWCAPCHLQHDAKHRSKRPQRLEGVFLPEAK